MKYALSLKGFELPSKAEKIITKQLSILDRKFHNFATDIPELSLVIKKHDKNHFYSSTMTIVLPKKKLIARIGGNELTDILHDGFEKINKEFETYKGKHFKGSSKYPYHDTFEDKKLDV